MAIKYTEEQLNALDKSFLEGSYREKLLDDLTIAGCRVHCRHGFDEAMQTIAKEHQKESVSYLIMEADLSDLSGGRQTKGSERIGTA